jgi:hypothetical protein
LRGTPRWPVIDDDHGTRLTVDEARALFREEGKLSYTNGFNVNSIWGEAGIYFRLDAVVDEMMESHYADYLPRDIRVFRKYEYARHRDIAGAINVYVVRSMEGRWGEAGFYNPHAGPGTFVSVEATFVEPRGRYVPDPGPGAFAFVSDRSDDLDSVEREYLWRSMVITTAHEIGHILGLPHMPEYENVMYGWGAEAASTELEQTQGRIAQKRIETLEVPPAVDAGLIDPTVRRLRELGREVHL